MRLPAGNDATVRAKGTSCGEHSDRSASCRYASLAIRSQRIGKASTDDPIEVSAFGGCAQQGCVHRCGNAEVLIDRPATELQLQQLPGVVVGNRRQCG